MLSEPKKNACLGASCDSSEKAKNLFLAPKCPKLAQNGPRFHTPPRVHKISQLLFYNVFDSMKYLVWGAQKLISKIGKNGP